MEANAPLPVVGKSDKWVPMYKASSDEIRKQFKQLAITLPAQFDQHTREILRKIRDDFRMVQENCSARKSSVHASFSKDHLKSVTQQQILDAMRALDILWAREPVFKDDEEHREVVDLTVTYDSVTRHPIGSKRKLSKISTGDY